MIRYLLRTPLLKKILQLVGSGLLLAFGLLLLPAGILPKLPAHMTDIGKTQSPFKTSTSVLSTMQGYSEKNGITLTMNGTGQKVILQGGQALEKQRAVSLVFADNNAQAPKNVLLFLQKYNGPGNYSIQAGKAADPKQQDEIAVFMNQQLWVLSAQKTSSMTCHITITSDLPVKNAQGKDPQNEIQGNLSCLNLPSIDVKHPSISFNGSFHVFLVHVR